MAEVQFAISDPVAPSVRRAVYVPRDFAFDTVRYVTPGEVFYATVMTLQIICALDTGQVLGLTGYCPLGMVQSDGALPVSLPDAANHVFARTVGEKPKAGVGYGCADDDDLDRRLYNGRQTYYVARRQVRPRITTVRFLENAFLQIDSGGSFFGLVVRLQEPQDP